jgi:hypothetical protein
VAQTKKVKMAFKNSRPSSTDYCSPLLGAEEKLAQTFYKSAASDIKLEEIAERASRRLNRLERAVERGAAQAVADQAADHDAAPAKAEQAGEDAWRALVAAISSASTRDYSIILRETAAAQAAAEDAEAALAATKAKLEALRAQAAAAAAAPTEACSPLLRSEENTAQTKSAASDSRKRGGNCRNGSAKNSRRVHLGVHRLRSCQFW